MDDQLRPPLHRSIDTIAPDGVVWRCPVCNAVVLRPHRPGRARVYCANACRQRAYRWRRQRRRRLAVAPPPQRATTLDRTHALRSSDDFVTPLVDGRGRRVTACGTFANAALDRADRHHHPWFFAATTTDRYTGRTSLGPWTCRRCTTLLDVPLRPLAEVLATIAARPDDRRRARVSPGGP